MTKQSDDLVVRIAELTDAEAMARVRVEAWRVAYRGLVADSYLDRPQFEREVAGHLGAALSEGANGPLLSVAELRGHVVGYCAYGSGSKGDDPGRLPTGGVYDLFVHPDYWHRGVGRELLEWATEYFTTEGFGEATLFVFEANARARAFYEHAGWSVDGYREIDERPDFRLPVVRYRKKLTSLDDERAIAREA